MNALIQDSHDEKFQELEGDLDKISNDLTINISHVSDDLIKLEEDVDKNSKGLSSVNNTLVSLFF